MSCWQTVGWNVAGSQTGNAQYDDRRVSWNYDEDGSLVIKGRLPVERGATLVKALKLGTDSAESKADVTADARDNGVTAETLRHDQDKVREQNSVASTARSYNGRRHAVGASRARERTITTAESPNGDVTAETQKGDVTAETQIDGVPAETSSPVDAPISHIEDGPHVTAETSR